MIKNSTNESSISNKYLPQFRYNESFALLTTLGFIWILSAASENLESSNLSILTLFIGITLFNPILKLVNKLCGFDCVKNEEAVRLLSTCMSIGIPFGMIVGFFAFIENTNLFYPAFGILFAVIFGIIGYLFRVWLYGVLTLVMILGCVYIGNYYPLDFTIGGYFAGVLMISIGVLHKLAGEVDVRLIVYRSKKFQVVKQ